MIPSKAYAALDSKSPLVPFTFERRDMGAHDVLIDIAYCGVCHSDIHCVRDEWSGSIYPMVPGHEIVGKVREIGSKVHHVKAGDFVGVGCMVNSCQQCANCAEGEEQFCDKGATMTYNAYEYDGKTPTQGGYSDNIVVNEKFVVKVPAELTVDLARVAPLLCAGITTYSPLKYWGAGPGKKVGVVGLGGLGHMAVKMARAFDAHVVLFTTSANKVEDALKLGAHEVVVSKDPKAMAEKTQTLDIILDTVAGDHNLAQYLNLLKRDGVMVMVGLPENPQSLDIAPIIFKRRRLVGSLIGGIAETQEMLNFCAKHHILSDIELIPIQKINEAYERILKSDVKYRFVIDMKTL